MPYISVDDVKRVLGAPDRQPSNDALELFIAEAEARVVGTIGVLPTSPRNEEIAGIIRDLAAARAFFRYQAGQSSEPPRMATALRDDALARLKDLDSRIHTQGASGEVDDGAYINPSNYLFDYEDFGLKENPNSGHLYG